MSNKEKKRGGETCNERYLSLLLRLFFCQLSKIVSNEIRERKKNIICKKKKKLEVY
jgi:hypothetical protein